MRQVEIWDYEEIDTDSNDFKEKIAESVKQAVLREWDNKIKITKKHHVWDPLTGEKRFTARIYIDL